ncbi:16S rRNA (guanine(966)-N(2))-methyltransferase RsmD [Helicobacter cappadocius]|uniref:16S rRNA (Guanine(966)-N(2))-methyltransferase RsmD n=1 Tax=Helicobacter cappadocius TaxID=3063998 RepID=A0AA90TBQ9_9HELI|nr:MULTISPECIES: 16S rRNA (guanine(966)-N(2))-methyltransferase RsmD [unclassified Helicobacter]MDO7252979.1 16S rRNA (guanine(966)-N(2))-methyltransferase RsmD [Helicobacter sp. faydin-H75]MDP2539031.1 16S rRNA (guanine(966)-N(2))-methyltransferase RsmD [Helicobacter sp. faydin-H76]
MDNKSTIKIIGGKFKGVNLKMPTTNLTRSSKSILKESLFNTISSDVIESCFIEAFAGTGSIGLEALSRGAKEAWFFENNKSSFDILSSNILLLKKRDPNILANGFYGDTFEILHQHINKNTTKKIIYFDPPFNIRENYADVYSKCTRLLEEILNPSIFLVVFEHMSEYKPPKNIKHFSIIKQKKFGKSSLTYYIESNFNNTKETNG